MKALSHVRGVLKLALVLALVAAPSAALAASGSGQVWAINCTREQYKPNRIVLACGDGGSWLGKLKWSSWGHQKAAATGNYSVNDCTPDCAAGHLHSYPVTVTLTKPKACPSQSHTAFKQVSLVYTATRPKGAPVKLSLRCPASLPGEY
jgi:hypothetical protein